MTDQEIQDLKDKVERYEKALKWIVEDSIYKAPEEHNWLSTRYAQRAQSALHEKPR